MLVKGGLVQIIMVLLILAYENCQAQLTRSVQGVVLEIGEGTGIKDATVFNKATKAATYTDSLGQFIIAASANDTIIISKVNYQERSLISGTFKDIQVYLSRITELAEVKIKGQSIKAAMKDLEDSYKDKGIFFKGKPPIYLLSPFGGSPVTFFYELFSKDSKRARRLQKFAKEEIEYSEVSMRFNDNIIKSVLPGISDIDLEKFRTAYMPKAEQIVAWSDYDLLAYIKRSFDQFKRNQVER
jgi:hypothetical protein